MEKINNTGMPVICGLFHNFQDISTSQLFLLIKILIKQAFKTQFIS